MSAAPLEAQDPLDELVAAVPKTAFQCAASAGQLPEAATALEQWAADRAWENEDRTPEGVLKSLETLLRSKQIVDRQLNEVLKLRVQFAALAPGADRRANLRGFLKSTSTLIDLSGRLRYLLRDAIDGAAYDLETNAGDFDRLLALLTKHRVSIGAATLSYALFDPADESGAKPFPIESKRNVLRLIAEAGGIDSVADLADFVREPAAAGELVVEAAEAIRRIGLPQDARPGQDPTLPQPSITARELADILIDVDASELKAGLRQRRNELLAWSQRRAAEGITGQTYRVGQFDLKQGDWLLMRNPSPYNLFTDLSPGLFTHVGVAAMETGEDGKRRCVIVDLPERGASIPATNVDAYLLRTVHFVFVRHNDAAVGNAMGRAALDMIGNPTQFDLTFRTSRVAQMKGKPLRGATIHTYCAGFLLLCAQCSTAPREEFFPINEAPAGGNCSSNLAKLGLAIGEDFVSPTGAMFSPHLKIVGSREPMYTPDREVKEAIYDYFAQQMVESDLNRSPNLQQALRERLAGVAKYNPLLARALARANNVSEKMDLESAARTAAVIETLDEIADGAMNDFLLARGALRAGPLEVLQEGGVEAERIEQIRKYRFDHPELFKQWAANRLSPRALRTELVKHYVQAGKRRIDERFFAGEPKSEP